MKNLGNILFYCLLLLLSSCSEKDIECDGICTEEFRTIVVSIVNSEGEPVALNNYEVVNLKDGRDLTIDLTEEVLQYMRETGSYPIFTDQYVQEFSQQQLQINFTGFIDGEEVVSNKYTVGADCCHVYHISGDLELVLE